MCASRRRRGRSARWRQTFQPIVQAAFATPSANAAIAVHSATPAFYRSRTTAEAEPETQTGGPVGAALNPLLRQAKSPRRLSVLVGQDELERVCGTHVDEELRV